MSKIYTLFIGLCICFLSLESLGQSSDCHGLNINSEIKQPSCGILNDGDIKLQVYGGEPPYAFEWNNGSKHSEIKVSEGEYFVRVTDSKGCQKTKKFSINAIQKLRLEIISTNPTTPQMSDGQIQCDFIGGVSPYKIQVSHYTNTNSVNRYSTDQVHLINLKEGKYVLDVIDSKGCVSTVTTVLSSQN